MASLEKIDIHNSVHAYETALRKLKEDASISNENRELLRRFLDDCELGRTARKKHRRVKRAGPRARSEARGRALSVRSRQRYLFYLKVMVKFFRNQRLETLKLKEIESFVRALETNEIRKADGEPYAEKSKSNLKKTLIIFLRWLLGEDSKKYYELTYWIDTRHQKQSKPSLDETQIEKLLIKCLTIKEKVLIASLFDGGMRIEEFLNVRMGDVTRVEGAAPYYRMHVREEFSKTTGRDVPFFWSQSYDLIHEWIKYRGNTAPDTPFYPSSYSAVQAALKRIGIRAQIPGIHAHLFRHSSATHFANTGWSEFQLNKKYGWSAHSDMGRQYVEQAKINIESEKRVREYEEEKLGGLQHALVKQQDENRLLQERNESMKGEHTTFKKHLDELEKRYSNLLRIAKLLEKSDLGQGSVESESLVEASAFTDTSSEKQIA